MSIKTSEKEINGKNVKIVLVGALDGIKITTQLSKVLFPVLGVISMKGEGEPQSVSEIVGAALEHSDELDLEGIIKKLFNGSTVDEFPIKPDEYFSGNYGELVDFLAFALEANFGSFFEAAILKNQDTNVIQKAKL